MSDDWFSLWSRTDDPGVPTNAWVIEAYDEYMRRLDELNRYQRARNLEFDKRMRSFEKAQP